MSSSRARRMPLLPVLMLVTAAVTVGQGEDDTVLWPERQRSFFQDGPALLLSTEQREELRHATAEEREAFIDRFLARDPVPETPENELVEGIRRRQQLRSREFLTLYDDRAQLLFLNGPPRTRQEIECGQTFKLLEIWTYGEEPRQQQLVLYQPGPDQGYRLWLPVDSKRVLYGPEMEYWLEQWEELRGRISGKRFDLQTCPETPAVDDATGVEGLTGYRRQRPTNEQLRAFLEAPRDLAAWAVAAAATALPQEWARLEGPILEQVLFPDQRDQRIVARFQVTVPAQSVRELGVDEEGGHLLAIEGIVEQGEAVFDRFKVRFQLERPADETPLALIFERALRPDRSYVLQLRLLDEVSEAETHLSLGFAVPREPQAIEEPPVPEGVLVAMGLELERQRIAGRDSLLLVPPETDVVLSLWRADALVTGERIHRVVFLVDGQAQMTRTRPPFSAELRISKFPTEQVVRAEGYDEEGELVAADEVILNQPRGAFKVSILEPRRGAALSGSVTARAEVVVPEERVVEKVEFQVNNRVVAVLDRPPWQATVEVPPGGEVAYLTVIATLDDGRVTEDVRFLNAPQYLEQVDVKLVELYTTVVDRSGRPVRSLQEEDFQVFEDGRPQEISKFELVEDLPLTIGITIDTSGSMVDSLPEAQRAAIAFLENIITRQDKAFAVSFSDSPALLIPPTDDVRAVEKALEDLRSLGWTTLHDAVVTTLYYFRGVRGRRAMVLLSDGDDTASAVPYRDALEYARRSGVTIYTVGLDVGMMSVAVRKKLNEWSEETGGRSFFISKAEELEGVYEEIEEELRSQYLLAYSSDRPTPDGLFREIEVKVQDGKLKARTLRGYYP